MKLETYLKKPIKQLRKIHWRYMSKYVRLRDGGVCITCLKKDDPKNMDAGHYFHSGTMDSFWLDSNFKNINCQCTTCNQYNSGRRDIYAVKLERKYGFGILQELDEVRLKQTKATREDVANAIINLKALLSYYE